MENSKAKSLILKTSVIFICGMLLLTFFSKTIYNFNLPNVTLAFPESGAIIKKAYGKGYVELTNEYSLYSDYSGTVTLFSQKGQRINKDDKLFEIVIRNDELEYSVGQKELQRNNIYLQMEKINNEIQYYQEKLTNLTPDVINEETSLEEYDIQIMNIEFEIATAEEDLATLESLYNAGAVSKSELEEKQRTISRLLFEKEQVLLQKEIVESRANKNNQSSTEDIIKNFENEKKELTKTVDGLNYQINSLKIEDRLLENEISKLKEGQSETIEVFAREDCIITDIHTKTGSYINRYSPVINASAINRTYTVRIELADDIDFIKADDVVKLNIKAKNKYNIQGTVQEIRYENGMQNAYIEFKNTDLTGGEMVEMEGISSAEKQKYVVPNSAIRKDSLGTHLLTVVAEKGPFGEEYRAQRLDVYVVNEDNLNSSIQNNGDFTDPVIINSDRVVYAGDKVKIASGSDIVEIR